MPLAQRLKFGLILVVAAFGGTVLYFGVLELELSKHAKPEPQELSLSELSADGYGDNAHVIVHDVCMFEWDYIYAEKRGRWLYAYVPAMSMEGSWYKALEAGFGPDGSWPEGQPLPAFDSVDMIVKLPDARSDEDVIASSADTTVQGVVINEIESLDAEERALLGESFPGVDLARCAILQLGREPATSSQAMMVIAGGAVLLLLGCLLGFFAWRKYQAEQALAADEG